MNTERDKFLTENVLNECWHDWHDSTYFGVGSMDVVYYCKKCDAQAETSNNYQFKLNWPKQLNDFSTGNGFIKLWNATKEKDWFERFISNKRKEYSLVTMFYEKDWLENLIHPDRFANKIYEFLTEQQGVKDD